MSGVLQTELQTDPLNRGYSQHLPNCPGLVADLLNAPTRTGVVSTFVNARTVLFTLGQAGAAILDALEAAAPNISAVKWMLPFIKSDAGVDVGSPAAQAIVDALMAGGILTSTQGNALKAMSLQPISRAQELGLTSVTILDIIGAQ